MLEIDKQIDIKETVDLLNRRTNFKPLVVYELYLSYNQALNPVFNTKAGFTYFMNKTELFDINNPQPDSDENMRRVINFGRLPEPDLDK